MAAEDWINFEYEEEERAGEIESMVGDPRFDPPRRRRTDYGAKVQLHTTTRPQLPAECVSCEDVEGLPW